MKTGFPNHPRKDLLEELEWIGSNGFDFVDLFLEADRAEPELIDIDALNALLKKYGLGIVGHTPWYLPIGSPERSYREFAVSEAARYMRVLARVNAEFMTVHANWPSRLFSAREGVQFQVESLRKIVHTAEAFGLNVMLEPMDTRHDDIEHISYILEKVPGLELHIDIGHANLFGRDPSEYVKTFHNKLRHIHLHDNDGNRDLHLPPGAGTIDWTNLVRVLKKHYDGTITLEIFSHDRELVLVSRDRLITLWEQS